MKDFRITSDVTFFVQNCIDIFLLNGFKCPSSSERIDGITGNLRTLGPWNDERCVQNVRPKRMLEKRIREMYLCYMYVFHMYWLVVMCKNPSTLYLILGKRIGDSVSGGIGDSVSVFSSMAALFAWQLPVFDRGKSHVLKDCLWPQAPPFWARGCYIQHCHLQPSNGGMDKTDYILAP